MLHRLCLISFFLSVITNFANDYEKAVAKRYMRVRQGIPEGCMERQSSWTGVVKTLFRYLFVVSAEDNDDCSVYAKAIVLEPFFEVSVMNAVTTTITKLVVTPANLIAESINTVFRNLMEGIPPFIVPLFLALILYVVTLLFLCKFRYSVSVPWLIDFRPTAIEHVVEKPIMAVKPKRARVVNSKLLVKRK